MGKRGANVELSCETHAWHFAAGGFPDTSRQRWWENPFPSLHRRKEMTRDEEDEDEDEDGGCRLSSATDEKEKEVLSVVRDK